MAEVGTYYITIMPEMSSFTGAVKNELKGVGKTGGNAYSGSFMDVVKGSAIGTTLGNLASKAGGAIAGGFSTGISRLDTIKNYPKVMESLGYSTDDADRSIKTIMGHLDGLPTATQDMVTLTQAISDSTGDLDLATAAALGFNDMMLANGASAAEVATAQGVLNRVLGKGSATAAQWQSLTSVMPAQLGMVAKSMLGTGASTEDLHEALENGTVSWNDFLQAIADLDKNGYIDEAGKKIASFEEQARANSHGIGTAIDNIRNRIGAGWADILDAVGQEQISSTIDKMSYGVRDGMKRIAEAIGYIKDAIGKTKIGENLGKIGEAISKHLGDAASAATPALKDFADGLIDFIDKALQWLVDHGDIVSSAISGIVAAIEGLIGLQILGLISSIPGALTALWAALSTNPMVLFVGVVSAAVGALTWFFTETETGQAIWQGFCDIMSDLWAGLQEDWKFLCDTLSREWENFKAFIDGIPEWWQGIMDYWSNALEEQKQNFALAWQKIKDDFAAAWDAIKQKAIDTWNGIKTNVTNLVNGIKTTLTNIWNNIKTTLTNLWNNLKTTVTNSWNGIKTTLANTVENIRNNIVTKWENIKTSISEKITAIKDGAIEKWNAIKTSISEKVEAIKTGVKEKFDSVKKSALKIFDDIKNGIKDKIQWAKDKVEDIVNGIKDLFDFEWDLPAPKLPEVKWHWHDIGGLLTIPVFDGIEWAAKGGIFDAATIIGIGEAGREAALPLNSKTYGEIAKGISGELDSGGITITGNQFVVREEADIERIAEALDRKIRRERLAMA